MATQIKRQNEIGSKQWGIYIDGKLAEGGFFNKDRAIDVAIKDYSYGRLLGTALKTVGQRTWTTTQVT